MAFSSLATRVTKSHSSKLSFAYAYLSSVMLCVTPAFSQQKEMVVTPIITAVKNSFGQQIVFPQGFGQVTASIYEIPPGYELPIHKHTSPRIGYVLDGILQVTNVETNESLTFKSGQIALECVDQWHKGSNPGTGMLKLLVIDLQPKGAGNPTVLKQ